MRKFVLVLQEPNPYRSDIKLLLNKETLHVGTRLRVKRFTIGAGIQLLSSVSTLDSKKKFPIELFSFRFGGDRPTRVFSIYLKLFGVYFICRLLESYD